MKIEKIRFYNKDGEFLWEKTMQLSRLWAVKDWFIHDGIWYDVLRVAIADEVQHVNVHSSRKV